MYSARDSIPEPGKILAWYCCHDDEPVGKGSHIERVWKKKRAEYALVGNSSMMRGATFEKPPCPRAVPLYANEADIALARPVYAAPADAQPVAP